MKTDFEIKLLIHHPVELPDTISKVVGLRSSYEWAVGSPRTYPSGRQSRELASFTMWNHIFDKVESDIITHMRKVILPLTVHAEYLGRLLKTGGRINLVLSLNGGVHNGFVISEDLLDSLHTLGISLGVEVFPEYREHDN